MGSRLSFTFNMARTLLSRLDGRAIAARRHEHLPRRIGTRERDRRARTRRPSLPLPSSAPRRHMPARSRDEGDGGKPHERVEPVGRAQQFDGQLHDPVAAANVRQLVREHDADAVGRPVERVERQQHFRARHTPCAEHGGMRRVKQQRRRDAVRRPARRRLRSQPTRRRRGDARARQSTTAA